MDAFSAAYDNIRLMRRKIRIAQEAADSEIPGIARDEAVIRVAALSEELIRLLHDFADMGFEECVAEMIATEGQRPAEGRAR